MNRSTRQRFLPARARGRGADPCARHGSAPARRSRRRAHADGVLVRRLERRAVGDRRRVEHDDVGEIARLQAGRDRRARGSRPAGWSRGGWPPRAACSFSSRTYLPSSRAKLPYARGCGDDFRNTPSGAIDAASEPKRHPRQRDLLADVLLRHQEVDDADARLVLEQEVHHRVDGSLPRVLATSASVLPGQRLQRLVLEVDQQHALGRAGGQVEVLPVGRRRRIAVVILRALGRVAQPLEAAPRSRRPAPRAASRR